MSLHAALRKAAGLIVQLPPESMDDSVDEDSFSTSEDTTSAVVAERPDIDQLLSEQGLGHNRDASSTGDASATGDASPSTTTPEAKTVEQIVRDAAGPNLDEIAGQIEKAAPTANKDAIDCPAIYAAAKLPDAPFTAEQMIEMLAQLPPELPLTTRRQTVQVTLGAIGKTIGAMPETIVADASRKIAALAAYSEYLTKRTEEFTTRTETEINELQAQIEEKRNAIREARSKLAATNTMCTAESDRLDDVLEFFSLDTGSSKYAPGQPSGANPAAPEQKPTA